MKAALTGMMMTVKLQMENDSNPHQDAYHQVDDLHSLGLDIRQLLMIQKIKASKDHAKVMMRLKTSMKLSAGMLSC